MSDKDANDNGRVNLKNWGMGILAAVVVSLLGWIGLSNLQSLSFQAAVQPQIATLVADTKETKQVVNDMKVEMSGYATKEQLAGEIRGLKDDLQEMEIELVRVCTLAGLPECSRSN
ncbi:hypothetical protein ACRXCV_00470 (plasmid) [Halobacteriovorax sp. GFR7]|uniref:hypothetical protein n=1 Tax=unclassified Halobacteriovorax TaxID=2639665 RepID=UPI003D958310